MGAKYSDGEAKGMTFINPKQENSKDWGDWSPYSEFEVWRLGFEV